MTEWKSPPSRIAPPGKGNVHVWRASLEGDLPGGWKALLSGEERQRADRFRTDELRQRFVNAHVALRQILSHYTSVPPETLIFATGDRGKPHLIAHDVIQFNLSHSAGQALIAVASDPVGVDTESHRSDTDWKAIARRFFNPAEQEEIAAAPEPQQPDAFYRCWTRKESFVKAVGGGIASGLESFSVGVFTQEPAIVNPLNNANPYTIVSLPQDTGWSAAVALHGTTISPQLFAWESAR